MGVNDVPDSYPLPVKVTQHQYREREHSLPYNVERGVALCVLATSELAMHQGLMLPDWGATTLFLNHTFELSVEQLPWDS